MRARTLATVLETFTIATFAGRVGELFALYTAGTRHEIQLIEVTSLGQPTPTSSTPGGRREPFSLVFRGVRDAVLPQQIYTLEHAALGTFEPFLVPLGPDEVGMRYEAIFA